MQSEHPGFQARRQNRFHQGLSGFEVFATDRKAVAVCQIHHHRNVHREIRSTIRKRHSGFQGRVGINHRRWDGFVVVAHRLLKRFQVAMHGVRLHENFSRGRPDHYQPRAFMSAFELGDFGD